MRHQSSSLSSFVIALLASLFSFATFAASPPPGASSLPLAPAAWHPIADGEPWQLKDGALHSRPGKILWRQAVTNYEIGFRYRHQAPQSSTLHLNDAYQVQLPQAADDGWHEIRATLEALPGKPPTASVSLDGKALAKPERHPQPKETAAEPSAPPAELTVPYAGLAGPPGYVAISADGPGLQIKDLWIRPLLDVDAAPMIERWSEESFARGKEIYQGLCVTCHGTQDKEGSLPTALKFHEGQFKNGSDPVGMYRTLSFGFGQMIPQNWMSPQQKFDVIHYVREAMLKDDNPTQYAKVDDAYLAALPPTADVPESQNKPKPRPKPYLTMDYSAALNWTLQLAKGNIVQKGILTRLDHGAGGVVKGKAWAIFDHDLMQWSSSWTGEDFVNWRGIAFDGSHGTHTSLKGEPLFINSQAPGWANPETGSWEDPRFKGLNTERRFGPLPRSWAHYKGTYKHGSTTIVSYTVGNAQILDHAKSVTIGDAPAMLRTLNLTNVTKPLQHRIAEDDLTVVASKGTITSTDGYKILTIPAGTTGVTILVGQQASAVLAQILPGANDLAPLTKGGPGQWLQPVTTEIDRAPDDAAYVVDTLTVPFTNPHGSWMRLSGLDFYPGGKSAAVCTWQGDVWRVDGIDQAEGTLVWTRIAAGLFQPLGLKIVDEQIYVGCRDQIVRLHDLNGDGEADYYESFNNDHQVTEHFHEFAMGLQTDAAGNFYYAKSACHARPAVVPHHGTLLKVTKDGSSTEILAHGFRAANGVCVNPDGTFFVTDQEGHWTPKNRINWIAPGNNFYGNYMGYHDAPGPEDKHMEEPMIWLTNKFNRSPGELLWATDKRWGPLEGQLLELSYGMGRIYLNLQETVNDQRQGGQVRLPIPDFDTGVMRGRFNPADGQLYALGMFAWAGNKRAPGNFHRLRYTGKTPMVPTALRTGKGLVEIDFPIAVDPAASKISVTSWHIARSKRYGSKHEDEKHLPVTATTATNNNQTLRLQIPELAPTRCMAIKGTCTTADGKTFTFEINNTIHNLGAVQ